MSRHHIVGKLEHRGAIAFYNETGPVTDSGTHTTFEYRDVIHNRDYYSQEIGKSQPTVYLTHVGLFDTVLYNRTPANGLPLASAVTTANADWQCNITINVNGTPAKKTGYIDDTGAYSPLRERFNRFGKSLSNQTGIANTTKNTSLEFGSRDMVQSATNTGWNPVTGFPFTLEAWAKPVDGGAPDHGRPRMVLGINHPGSDTSATVPGSTWRHWGIGFAGTNNAQTDYKDDPAIMWGGWDSEIEFDPDYGDQVVGLPSDPIGVGASIDDVQSSWGDDWQHIVGVFYGPESFALYSNGRCVQYSGDVPDFMNTDPENKQMCHMDENSMRKFGPWNYGAKDRRITPISGNLCVSLGGNRHQDQGTDAWHYSRDFHGSIAHSAIYDRALSTREVYDHYITMTQGANLVTEGNSSTSDETRLGGVTHSSEIKTWGNKYGKQIHINSPVTVEGLGDPPNVETAYWSFGKRAVKYRSFEYSMAVQGGLYRNKQSHAVADEAVDNSTDYDYLERDNYHSSGTSLLMYLTPSVNATDISNRTDDYTPAFDPSSDDWSVPFWNNYGRGYDDIVCLGNCGYGGMLLNLTKVGSGDIQINAKWGNKHGSTMGGEAAGQHNNLTGWGSLITDKVEPASPFKMNPLMATSVNVIPRLNSIGFLLNADETSVYLNKSNLVTIGATSTGTGINLQPTDQGTLRHIWYQMRGRAQVDYESTNSGALDMNISYCEQSVVTENWFPATRMGPYALLGDGTIEHTPNVSGDHRPGTGSTMVDLPTLDRLIRGRPPMRRRFGLNVCRRHFQLSRMPLRGQR